MDDVTIEMKTYDPDHRAKVIVTVDTKAYHYNAVAQNMILLQSTLKDKGDSLPRTENGKGNRVMRMSRRGICYSIISDGNE